VPARAELQAGERLDRDGVGLDARDVAHDHRPGRLGQQPAHAGVEAGQVCAQERSADREGDHLG
jgi:hypothetical protein